MSGKDGWRYGRGMKLAPIWNPDARKPSPKPVQVDLFPIFLTGTLIWFIAFVTTLICCLQGLIDRRFPITCLFGTLIGIALLIWERVERRIYRRLGNDADAQEAAARASSRVAAAQRQDQGERAPLAGPAPHGERAVVGEGDVLGD